jgi:hypothetical protein
MLRRSLVSSCIAEKGAFKFQGAANLLVPQHLEDLLERLPGCLSGLARQEHCDSGEGRDQMFVVDRCRSSEVQCADQAAFRIGDYQSHRLGEIIFASSHSPSPYCLTSQSGLLVGNRRHRLNRGGRGMSFFAEKRDTVPGRQEPSRGKGARLSGAT